MSKQAVSPPLMAVITGASRGIGATVASELARRGYRLALLARSQKRLEETAQNLEGAPEVRVFPCDLQDSSQVERTFKDIFDWAGQVDVLVNNAGVGVFAPLVEISDSQWDSILDTNLRGVFYCARAVIPRMKKQQSGYIINISSLAGKNAFPGGTAYCASKWGLQGLTYCLAEELRQHNIRVSVICPGSVHTEFSPHTGKDPERMLQPADVARTVGWLLEQEPQSFVSEISLRPTQKP